MLYRLWATRMARKIHLEVERITQTRKSASFSIAWLSIRKGMSQPPPAHCRAQLTWGEVKSRVDVSGPNNSRECGCEHIQEGDQALNHRRWKKQPLSSDGGKEFLPDFILSNQVSSSYAAIASRHMRSCKVLQVHQQELPMFHPGGFPLPRISVYLGLSRAKCWFWGCCSEKKNTAVYDMS